jgi:predicted ATPase/DNA-binding SARP family transcriptional activator
MEVRLLGPVDAIDADGRIDLGGRKQRTLAALLAAHDHQRVSIDRCIDALWGDSPPDAAAHSLQTYVSNLRRLIDPDRVGLLESGGDGYRLLADTDAERFESAVTSDDHDATTLADALDLWRGRPLGDLADDEWAHGFVTRWERLRVHAMGDLASARLAAGDAEAVVVDMESAVADHPYHEAFWAHYMTALYQTGRQTEALRAFTHLKTLLGEELGIEPSVALSELEEQILLHDPSLARVVTTPHNLPAEMSSLIGRVAHITEVLDLLEESRLVTLTGSGGVGKTRLAVAAARSALPDYPEGVWFIDLSRLEHGQLVLPAIATTLSVEPPALRPLEDALTEAIGTRRVLLVLDNCDHVIDAAAEATGLLLSRNPGARIIATSREVLRIEGEIAWRVPSLTIPEVTAALTAIASSESGELFAQRARATDPSFRVTEENAEDVASICRRLDGIPLAIELAAARSRAHTPRELDRRLSDTFDVLTSEGRDALPRHRTLRATIEWSYDHLDERTQAFFDQLGVFVGGFTIDAAAAVTRLDVDDVLDLIDDLVGRSMIQPSAGAERRFRLLATLRQYACEQLVAAGNLEELLTRHLEWATTYCLSESPKLMGDEQVVAIENLIFALDDIRSAMEWSLECGRSDEGLETATSLSRFWYLNAMHFEGAEWLDRLFAAEPELSDLKMGRALTARATTLVRIGRLGDAVDSAQRAVDLLEPLDEPIALGWAYYYLGVATVADGYENRDEVLRLWSQARDSHAQAGYKPGIALSSMLIGAVVAEDRPEEGILILSNLVDAAGPNGNPTLVGHCLELRANVLVQSGKHAVANEDLVGAVRAHHTTGNWACLAHTFEGVAGYLVAVGREPDAASVIGGIETLRLNISTIQAPYERFLVGFYPWVDALPDRPDLVAPHEAGRRWDREQLVGRVMTLLGSA